MAAIEAELESDPSSDRRTCSESWHLDWRRRRRRRRRSRTCSES
jgi:hypothetical protein